jgi:uroporphyrinogen decarboxylase
MDAVFQGRVEDRVPSAFWFHFSPDAESSDALKNPEAAKRNFEGHRRYIQSFQPDLVKVMSDGFFFYPLDSPVRTAADLNRAVTPLSDRHPWIEAQVDLLGKVVGVDPDAYCFYNVFSPLNTLRFTIGRLAAVNFLLESPEIMRECLLKIGEGLSRLARAQIERGGAEGIYLSVQNPDTGLFSEDFYAACVAPSERMVLDAAAGAGGRNILHICGYAGVKNHVPFYASYDADVYNWAVNVEKVSLKEGRRMFPGKVLLGGFPNAPGSVIHQGGQKEIRAFAEGIVREAGPERLVIGADCTVPNDISLERLGWAREGGRLKRPGGST